MSDATAYSTFSGIGGLDEGLRRAGFRHAFLCESDPWRRGVLAERFPGVPIHEDVRDVEHPSKPDAIVGRPVQPRRGRDAGGITRDEAGRVDLVCGGFPCQDLSVAGRRAGLIDGDRSSLFFEFARVADLVLAAGGWILVENVPGLLSSNHGRDFALVLATLAELGFHDLAWRILDSRHFGVPQRRRRVFIVGRRAAGDRACKVLLEPESGGGDFAPLREAGPGVAGTLGGGAGERGWAQDTERMTFIPQAMSAKWAKGSSGPAGDEHHNLVSTDAEQSYHAPREDAIPTRKLRRAVSDGHMVRRLTPVECERLQALPDNWTRVPNDAPDSRRYAALGDAVTVSVAEWIGRRILHEAGA